jgi:hypothetical protein
MKTLFMVGLLVAVMCTAASAGTGFSFTGFNSSTVYEMDQPTSWAISYGGPNVVLPGQGPNGTDAYYRPGNQGSDDGSQAFWKFDWAGLPNVGHDLNSGKYQIQVYVSDYGTLSHEDNGVFGTANGPWGYEAMGQFSSWNGFAQASPGWVNAENWVGGYAWLSSGENEMDIQVAAKWNPWGGYGGCAVSGVRVSLNAIPEPSSLLALLTGIPALALLRRKS